MHLSDRPGLGVTLTEQARAWTVDRVAHRRAALTRTAPRALPP